VRRRPSERGMMGEKIDMLSYNLSYSHQLLHAGGRGVNNWIEVTSDLITDISGHWR
jgi:hypothetical protein